MATQRPWVACLASIRSNPYSRPRHGYNELARTYSTTQIHCKNSARADTSEPTPPAYKEPQKFKHQPAPPLRDTSDRTPKPLDEPLGVPRMPRPGENTGADGRSIRQRRDDFVNYDKHLEKRTKMTSQIARSYFKDFNDMKYFKGKTFVAPTRLFKGEHAMYFPNLRGNVLTGKVDDTTNVLTGNVSVVGVVSSYWAEKQLRTFCGPKEHPALQPLLADIDIKSSPSHGPQAQLVEINHEPNFLKYWLLRLFSYRLRSERPKARWGQYFVIRTGFIDHLRYALAITNQKVGYVYLVDARCKVRWAGSALASDAERSSMVSCLRRLLKEQKDIEDNAETSAANLASRADSPISQAPGPAAGEEKLG